MPDELLEEEVLPEAPPEVGENVVAEAGEDVPTPEETAAGAGFVIPVSAIPELSGKVTGDVVQMQIQNVSDDGQEYTVVVATEAEGEPTPELPPGGGQAEVIKELIGS